MIKVANGYPIQENAKQQPVRSLRQVALCAGCLETTNGGVIDIAYELHCKLCVTATQTLMV